MDAHRFEPSCMLTGMKHRQTLHFVDRDFRMRAELSRAAFGLGHHAEVYASFDELIERPPGEGIIIARDDSDEGGIARNLFRLFQSGIWLPAIAIAEKPDAKLVVEAIKAGALDYLELPVQPATLARSLERVAEEAELLAAKRQRTLDAKKRVNRLSRREGQVLEHLVTGKSNKEIARELQISPRTVEIHRANMMLKLGVGHAAEAVKLAIEARRSHVGGVMPPKVVAMKQDGSRIESGERGSSASPPADQPAVMR